VRYAFLSDVHSNLESLERAMERIENADAVVSLGDMVGYGANPNECLAILQSRVQHAVLGNHDLAAVEGFGIEHFNEYAREAILWTQQVLGESAKAWLDTLGYELRFPEFLLVHGAPVRYFEYILEKRDAARAFEATDARLIFVGHTHIAQYWVKDADANIGHRHMQHGGVLRLEAGKRYIVDAGSVGQPRDANPEACLAFYEPENENVEWVRYAYDVAEAARKIREAGLPSFLADRLRAGK
jgi:diadenosine tetraphosphatase ApaH/serine/threonine PP2A family protein phosphatase